MTSKVAPYLAAAAIALTLPLSALAQQGGKSMPGASPAPAPAPAPSQNQATPGGSDAGKSAAPGAMKQQFQAADLKGKDVYDAAGKKVGSIDEVVPATGQPRDAILSVGGILGIGAKKVLIPVSDIERGNEGRLTVSMTQEQLDKLPEYEAPKRDAGPAPGTAPKRP